MSARIGRPKGTKNSERGTEQQRRERDEVISGLTKEIRERRIKLDVSQVELAKAAGTSAVTINQFENGLTSPTLITLIPILTALGLKIELKKTIPGMAEVTEVEEW